MTSSDQSMSKIMGYSCGGRSTICMSSPHGKSCIALCRDHFLPSMELIFERYFWSVMNLQLTFLDRASKKEVNLDLRSLYNEKQYRDVSAFYVKHVAFFYREAQNPADQGWEILYPSDRIPRRGSTMANFIKDLVFTNGKKIEIKMGFVFDRKLLNLVAERNLVSEREKEDMKNIINPELSQVKTPTKGLFVSDKHWNMEVFENNYYVYKTLILHRYYAYVQEDRKKPTLCYKNERVDTADCMHFGPSFCVESYALLMNRFRLMTDSLHVSLLVNTPPDKSYDDIITNTNQAQAFVAYLTQKESQVQQDVQQKQQSTVRWQKRILNPFNISTEALRACKGLRYMEDHNVSSHKYMELVLGFIIPLKEFQPEDFIDLNMNKKQVFQVKRVIGTMQSNTMASDQKGWHYRLAPEKQAIEVFQVLKMAPNMVRFLD